MAQKKKKPLPPDIRKWVNNERAHGRMTFFDGDGNAASVPRKGTCGSSSKKKCTK